MASPPRHVPLLPPESAASQNPPSPGIPVVPSHSVIAGPRAGGFRAGNDFRRMPAAILHAHFPTLDAAVALLRGGRPPSPAVGQCARGTGLGPATWQTPILGSARWRAAVLSAGSLLVWPGPGPSARPCGWVSVRRHRLGEAGMGVPLSGSRVASAAALSVSPSLFGPLRSRAVVPPFP